MKTCIFCGKSGGSLEHIFAQWLIQCMEAQTLKVFSAFIDGEGKPDQRPEHTLKNFVTRAVCTECNNGWMSELEQWFKNHMSELVKPEWPKFAPEWINLALRDMALRNTDALTKWALKTATMINSSSMLKCIEDTEMCSELYQRRIVPGVFVYLAYIDQPAVTYTMPLAFLVTDGQSEPTLQNRGDGKAYWCLIQMNHLAILVFRCVGAEPYYSSFNHRMPLRIFPEPCDPYSLDFRFHTLTELENSLYLTTDISQGQSLVRQF